MISADLNRMYARALEEQRRGRDIEKARRERIEAEVARLDAERIRASEEAVRRKHKRQLNW